MKIYWIRGSSNLSVDKIYSIVVLKKRVFFPLSNNVFPYNRVCDKEDLVNSSNLQSILFKVLRRVHRSSLNVGQLRRKCEVDSISKRQLQIGFQQFWKLCLNLCSRKWFIPTRSQFIIYNLNCLIFCCRCSLMLHFFLLLRNIHNQSVVTVIAQELKVSCKILTRK